MLSAAERAALQSAVRSGRIPDLAVSQVSPDDMSPDVSWPSGGYLGALPPGPLVARDVELQQILSGVDATASGFGRLVLLAGEPGIGKTRLAQEVALAARDRRFLVATGRCYEPEQTVAYYPFLEALSSAYQAAPAALRAVLPQRWPEVLRLLPDQQMAVGVTAQTPDAIPPAGLADQQRLLWAVTGFVRALAEQHPVALLLDDLHWADSASRALLMHLARHTRASRVLLLGTYRDVEITRQHPLGAVLRELGREQLIEQVDIGALSPAGTAALVATVLGAGAVPADIASILHQRAEGNPLFTHQLLRTLMERGDIYRNNGGWQRRAVAELRVPVSVRTVIGERVARLATPTQQTLGEASVLGQTFSFGDLAAMRTRDEAELEAALEEATTAGLVRETGDDGYAFQHVLIQEALYEEMPARRKQRLHGLIGEALEQLPERARERRVAELAYHYLHSHTHAKALGYLVRAAEHAHAASAFKEEVALLDPAIELAAQEEQAGLEVELRAKRGLAYWAISSWKEADRDLTDSLASLAPDQYELRARVLIAMAQVRQWLWDSSGTRRYATEALELAERIGRSDLAVAAISALGTVDSFDGNLHASLEHFHQAFTLAGQDNVASLASGLSSGVEWSGMVLYWLADYPTAVERERQALDLARRAHNLATTSTMSQTLGLALAASGRYGEALQAIAEGEHVAQQHESWPLLARGITIRGGVHLDVFDFVGAEALAEEAREMSRSASFPNALVSAGIDLLLNWARRSEVGHAEHLVHELDEAAIGGQGHHRWLWQVRLAQAHAELALARGDWETALRWAEDAIARSRLRGRVKYEIAGLATRGQALAGYGRTEEAIATLQQAVALARPVGDPAMFLRVSSSLLALDGDDALLAEARAAVDRIIAALPTIDLVRHFQSAEPVRVVERLAARRPVH